ncbi:MAG: DEAD/DEAH box helicase [Armatimonadetes bacterium]|nr:DEAD/DEAH box helicase [Armatimonadota bacterium]
MGPTEVVNSILGSRPLHVEVLEPSPARFAETQAPLHHRLAEKLESFGVPSLYEHQARAFDLARNGKDVMVVTGTSSGKSLCYNLPVIDTCLREPVAKALYLFPTKALAQDQEGKLRALLPDGIRCGTYDGDTPSASRSAVRKSAHLVLTNPDMLHVGILPSHENWRTFLRSLKTIVLDEAHVYKGAFGSHVAWVIQRLLRICAWHGCRPQVIACSATVANPAEVFEKLTGRSPELVEDDAGPKSRRTIVLVEPPDADEGFSPNKETAGLLAEFAMNGVRCMAFCRARSTTELVVMAARRSLEKMGGDPDWVDSYRGGYTPKERRQIEQRLFKGQLRGLATTNAMELGVDVGSLDATVLNGFPGSVSSFWQQTGRAGRGQRDGLSLMIAHDEPLERFLVREPELLLGKAVESVSLDPLNRQISEAQLRCAAYERPIGPEEYALLPGSAEETGHALVASGDLADSAGRLFYPSHESPAKNVNIRGTGGERILLVAGGQPIGEMERWRALRQAHAGAVYLHRGQSYLVEELDLDRRMALMALAEPAYYTEAVVNSLVEVSVPLETDGNFLLAGVRVTTTVSGFVSRQFDRGAVIAESSLESPVETFDTVGVRIELPDLTVEDARVIHAVQHALTFVAPLTAGCDRNDLGSCWYVMSPEAMKPSVVVYDTAPGGLGYAESLFRRRNVWWEQAGDLLSSCPCLEGCPACLLSPLCESWNEGLDKQGALKLLRGT